MTSTQNVLFDAPGPKARARHLALTVFGAILVAVAMIVVLLLVLDGLADTFGGLASALLAGIWWGIARLGQTVAGSGQGRDLSSSGRAAFAMTFLASFAGVLAVRHFLGGGEQ